MSSGHVFLDPGVLLGKGQTPVFIEGALLTAAIACRDNLDREHNL